MARLSLASAGLYPVLQVRSLLLTLLLFLRTPLRFYVWTLEMTPGGAKGGGCFFKATRLGTPPAFELPFHALFQAREISTVTGSR